MENVVLHAMLFWSLIQYILLTEMYFRMFYEILLLVEGFLYSLLNETFPLPVLVQFVQIFTAEYN